MKTLVLVLALLCATPALAQEPVKRLPDAVSWATAFANPTWAAVDALRSPHRSCELKRLALSEAVSQGLTFTLKHFIISPRPCLGCAPDGFPSGHTLQSVVGVTHHWQFGLMFTLGTADLRVAANRHTPWQVAAGAALGLASEGIAHLTFHCD